MAGTERHDEGSRAEWQHAFDAMFKVSRLSTRGFSSGWALGALPNVPNNPPNVPKSWGEPPSTHPGESPEYVVCVLVRLSSLFFT